MLLVVGDMALDQATAAVQLPAAPDPASLPAVAYVCRPPRTRRLRQQPAGPHRTALVRAVNRSMAKALASERDGERPFEPEGALSGSPSAGQQSELAFVMHTLAVKLDDEGA